MDGRKGEEKYLNLFIGTVLIREIAEVLTVYHFPSYLDTTTTSSTTPTTTSASVETTTSLTTTPTTTDSSTTTVDNNNKLVLGMVPFRFFYSIPLSLVFFI